MTDTPFDRYSKMTFREKMEFTEFLTRYPALTLMVFTRCKIGYRTLSPIGVLIMAGIIPVAQILSLPLGSKNGWLLNVYVFLFLVAATIHRKLRWYRLCRGERLHTYSVGTPWLGYLPLPQFMYDQRRIYRFLEPIVCALLAIAVGVFVSVALGGWLALASLALFLHENTMYERLMRRHLDILDSLVEAEVQKETTEQFTTEQPKHGKRMRDTGGIATGVDSDIERQIAIRRKKAEKTAPPDNLEVTV